MIYVFLAEGFEEIEAITIIDVLRRAELPLKTVSIDKKEVTGSHQIKVFADETIESVILNEVEMIILPGGMPGTKHLMEDENIQAIIEYAVENNILIGAICAAPMILGELNMLCGKRAVSYPGYESHLRDATIGSESVVRDGNIITSKGPGTAFDFAYKIVEILKGRSVAERLMEDMIYN